MKYTNKNPLEKLHTDEPYFFIRAQDKLAALIVQQYAHLLLASNDVKGFKEVLHIADEIGIWQENNLDKLKMPD